MTFGDEFLERLEALRLDSLQLHRKLERKILSGGVCKQYGMRHGVETLFFADFYAPRWAKRPARGLAQNRVGDALIPCPLPRPGVFEDGVHVEIQAHFREAISKEWKRPTYSERFLHRLLAEKREKEILETQELGKKFKALPVPATTYFSDSKFVVRRLKRGSALHALRLKRLKELESALAAANAPIRRKPIPATTFIAPFTEVEEVRRQRRRQRAIDTLVTAHEPRGMKDHSIRWRVRSRLRHYPCCFVSPHSLPYQKKPAPQRRRALPSGAAQRILSSVAEEKLAEKGSHSVPTMNSTT